ncbi:MAG: multidrug effflux MFS transporter [Pseudomonadota bacterium]
MTALADNPERRLPLWEFVALMAMLSATIAFSIDAMLPALPQIGQDLSPDAPNAVQFVIVAFVMGMGAGTFFAGPLSDALGRKPVMLGGAALYCSGAILSIYAPNLWFLVAARLLQGLGAAGPRVVAQAMIRDLYMGRGMARVSSFVMMTFTLAPAVAPLIGAWISAGFGWRGIFWSFVVFSVISGLWLALRQAETLPVSARRPLRFATLLAAAREVGGHRNVRRAVVVQTLVFGMLFSAILSVQPIYDQTFGRGDTFPLWFFLVAILAGAASFLNATLVGRLGMLWLLRRVLLAHLLLSVILLKVKVFVDLPDDMAFGLFVLWQVGTFALAGLTVGNLNAIAMTPMGHIAGMAASVISAVSTVFAIMLAVPVGLAFDGTQMPLITGVALYSGLALWRSMGLRE